MFRYYFMDKKQILLWIGALAVGLLLGWLNIGWVNNVMTVVATVFTRLFRFLAVPTIVLAITTTLASLGAGKEMGKLFKSTLCYTLLTTFCASAVALGLYLLVAPGNLPSEVLSNEAGLAAKEMAVGSYADHLINVIPENIVKPLLEGNVLSLLLICFAVGIALSIMPDSESKKTVLNGLVGIQEILYKLIHWLIAVMPIGIVAFSAQMIASMSGGVMLDSIGKYVVVILGGNCVQFFIVLPLILLLKGLNPIKVMGAMFPAVMMAFFTKSSAATLPVTIECAEKSVKVPSKIARFVLPICTTMNMNGCAAFILATSFYVMQNNGMELSATTMILWLLISVISAVGNAGVPMGCYFMTLSLMSGIGADIAVMGIILPIYTVIDMVETAENVWSDSCVCALTGKVTQKTE